MNGCVERAIEPASGTSRDNCAGSRIINISREQLALDVWRCTRPSNPPRRPEAIDPGAALTSASRANIF